MKTLNYDQQRLILKAARKLQSVAEDLRKGHTIAPEFEQWLPEDVDARWEHDDLQELAHGLRRIAE